MLLFCDGADHEDTGLGGLKKWTTGQTERTTTNQRSGLAGWTNQSNGAQFLQLNLGANYTTLIAGMAVKINTTSNHLIFRFSDSATAQIDLLYVTSTGCLLLRNGDQTTVLANGTTVISHNVYYYVEVKVTFGNSAAYEVRLNEITEMSGTGDTTFSANNYANRIQIFGSSAAPIYLDDLYLIDTVDSGVSGAPNNDFLGDVVVDTILPNGNGNSSQFVGQDANSTDNYLNVDEAPPDDDTTYNESGTPGNKDTYAYANMSVTSGEVFGVQVLPYARKTAAGARTMKSVARLSGVESDGPEKSLLDTYLYLYDMREADPGGSQWTIANVNAAEFGAKVIS